MPERNPGIALLPIRPKYVKEIISGRKKVEFRKRRFARPVQGVVIYATSPIKKVVAHFRISLIAEGNPEEVWEEYSVVAGIAKADYMSYFKNAKLAVAIGISDLLVLENPLTLKEVTGRGTVPQCYSYLSYATFEALPALAGYFTG